MPDGLSRACRCGCAVIRGAQESCVKAHHGCSVVYQQTDQFPLYLHMNKRVQDWGYCVSLDIIDLLVRRLMAAMTA